MHHSSTSIQGCGLGLETYQRLVSVSAIDVSYPRPTFRQILQVTIIKLIKSVVAVNESLAELV